MSKYLHQSWSSSSPPSYEVGDFFRFGGIVSTTLDIVNECLGTMGEVPLNSLADPHAFKGAALRALEKSDATIQGKAWWYNTEELDLVPSPDDGQIYLPGDVVSVSFGFVGVGTKGAPHQRRYVQRGRRLYDLQEGTYVITRTLRANIRRRLALDLVPPQINDLIRTTTVLAFQSNYDGDNNRRAELVAALNQAAVAAAAENTKQTRLNLLDNNPRLQRIRRAVNGVRLNH